MSTERDVLARGRAGVGSDRVGPGGLISSKALLIAFWLLPAAVATLGLRLVPSRLNPDLTLVEVFASQLLIWLPWAGWSALIVAVCERVPFERGGIGRALAAHAVLSPAVIIAQILIIWEVSLAFGMNEPRGFDSRVLIGIRQYGDLLMVVYWAVVGAQAGLAWHARWQEESLRAAQLREDLATASLQALRAQLNPHFLFNALNSVVTLIGRDASTARAMLVRLSDLLRATLAAGDAQETTVAQEIALVAHYLEIEQVRFADRLNVQWTLDPVANELAVPAFTLQPLVENALKHGLGRRQGPGSVEVITRCENGTLELVVRDGSAAPTTTAAGAPLQRSNGAGIALANLRARLERLHGVTASVDLKPNTVGGTDAVVRLPARGSTAASLASGRTR